MMSTKVFGTGLLVAALALTGCGKSEPSKPDAVKGEHGKDKKDDKGEDHAHGNGPKGGVVFDLGKEHAELRVDHANKTIAVAFLDDVEGKKEKDWPPLMVAAKELTLTTKETKTKEGKVVPPMTITLKPVDAKDGKASVFSGSDPGLGNVADFSGTVAGEVDGKPASGTFKE